jgi:hypothetical protein
LNPDVLTPPAGDFIVNDLFFVNVPLSLPGNTDSGSIGLFDIQVGSSAYGLYTGGYVLRGGTDGAADNQLAVAGFAVQVVPEPAPIGIIGVFLLFGFLRIRRNARSAGLQ